jgi:hypothetical protein
MAQTITAVRGNTAYTPNNTNELTLYTNGSGGSTRVIINSCGFIRSNSTNDQARYVIYLRNSGGGSDMPVAMISNNVITNAFFLPGVTSVPQSSSAGYGILFPVTQGSAAITPQQLFVATLTSGIDSGCSYCPKSIWMGPSDVLIFRGYNGANTAGNVVWNFTAITES